MKQRAKANRSRMSLDPLFLFLFYNDAVRAAKFYQGPTAHIRGRGGTIYGCDTRTAVFAENARKENAIMSTKNTNKLNVPQARAAMDKFKMEAASEVGVYPP